MDKSLWSPRSAYLSPSPLLICATPLVGNRNAARVVGPHFCMQGEWSLCLTSPGQHRHWQRGKEQAQGQQQQSTGQRQFAGAGGGQLRRSLSWLSAPDNNIVSIPD